MLAADFLCLVVLTLTLPLSPPILSVVAPCTMIILPTSTRHFYLKLLRLAVAVLAFVYTIIQVSYRANNETTIVLLTLSAAAALDSNYRHV